MPDIKVSELNIYPVKSMRQITLDISRLGPFGLQHDRRWMVVDKEGYMVTQRQQARMCLIQPKLHENSVELTAQGMSSIVIEYPESNKTLTATVWNDECQVCDAGDEAAIWLSDFLSIDCRLVYFPDDEIRQVDLNYENKGERTAFSDGFPLLLTSQASLVDLNQRLATPVPMKRFRPNLVVTGCNAFAEDEWDRIRIGDIIFRVVKPCSRCIIPNIDIETANKSNEPARTLATYRKTGNSIFFGQNVIAENEGELSIGMPVEVIA